MVRTNNFSPTNNLKRWYSDSKTRHSLLPSLVYDRKYTDLMLRPVPSKGLINTRFFTNDFEHMIETIIQ